MRFDIYGRTDGLRIVVPSVLPLPSGLATEGPLVSIGTVALSFAALTPGLSHAIALSGFGVAGDLDDAMIDLALREPGPAGERW
ncbi:hypothetical protein [Cognatilysobacter segetis]|uniref:hypothetical protein n=1 Tax=Cognatilysobacter segetis TaxID=2492394 RepID=UPI00105E340D|nr:hypothetical protein [Lysobacter segetis]